MSQLNTDTIANELGTGGPDFVGMPTVAGDPVVESGSNSDGQWTRYADGTQMCTSPSFPVDITFATGNIFKSDTIPSWTFPAAFVSKDGLVCVASSSDNSFTWANSIYTTTTATSAPLVAFSSGSTTNNGIVASAIGRWK